MDLQKLFEKKEWNVFYVTALWIKVNKKWDKTFILDKATINGIEKLVQTIEQVKEVTITPETMKELEGELLGFIEWACIDSNKNIKTAYRKAVEFFQKNKEDEVVNTFVNEYIRYVKDRFGMDVVLNRKSVDVIKASLVSKKAANKYNIGIYEVIKYQHEWWAEGIKTPFTAKSLGREEKVDERLQKYFAMRKGEVLTSSTQEDNKSNDNIPGITYVKKRWKEILQMGVGKFLSFARGGFLVDICKQFLAEYTNASSEQRDEVVKKYNEDYIAQIWIEKGKPLIIL